MYCGTYRPNHDPWPPCSPKDAQTSALRTVTNHHEGPTLANAVARALLAAADPVPGLVPRQSGSCSGVHAFGARKMTLHGCQYNHASPTAGESSSSSSMAFSIHNKVANASFSICLVFCSDM